MISNKKLMELYTAMVKCRMAAEFGFSKGVPEPADGTLPESMGEAILAGAAIDLQRGDSILHPSLGAVPKRMKDAPLDRIFLALARNARPAGAKKQSSGDATLKAISKAAKTAREKKDAITVAFCEGIRATGAEWKKHLKQASRKKLPVLFFCPEHDLHASHRKKIAETEALLHGVPVIVVDGRDVVAVYRVASESIARARQRRGPTVIATAEATPAPDSTPARTRRHASTSLAVMEKHLKEQNLYRASKRATIERTFRRNLVSAIRTRTR